MWAVKTGDHVLGFYNDRLNAVHAARMQNAQVEEIRMPSFEREDDDLAEVCEHAAKGTLCSGKYSFLL